MSAEPDDKVNLAGKLAQFTETWSPRIVGALNGQHVKLVKVEGEFVWHHHADEDELFLVLEGRLAIHLRDRTVTLEAGEFFIVPRGIEHKPEAESLTHVLVFEPAATLNTETSETHAPSSPQSACSARPLARRIPGVVVAFPDRRGLSWNR